MRHCGEQPEKGSNMHRLEELLTDLKRQYTAQVLPPMLEERIRESMKKEFQEEQTKRPLQSSFLRGIYKGLGAAAAALAVITVLANAHPATAKAMQDIPILGPLAQLLTFRTYADSQYGIEAHIEIPQLDSLQSPARENLQNAVDAYVQSLIALHEESVAAAQDAYAQNPAIMEESQTAHQSLDTACTVLAETEDMFCLGMTTDLVMAGASESSRHFVLDKRTGQLLTLSDLFLSDSSFGDVLSTEVKRQMDEKSAMDETLSYFPEDVSIGSSQDFYITQDGQLVLCFDEYAVAPGYMGALDFIIPTQAIEEILNTDLLY